MTGQPLAPSFDRVRPVIGAAVVVALPVAVGAALGRQPSIAFPLIVLLSLALWLILRGARAWWDLLVVVVGGVYILNYGFANVGLKGAVPIPLVDLAAAALLVRAGTRAGFQWPRSSPFVLALMFGGLTALRLVVDVQTYGVLAIRDATLAFELSFFFVGYWAIWEYGLERLLRMFSIVFVLTIGYVALYPVKDTVAAVSPMVGLQRPVPLLGNFSAETAVAGALFFFALVRPYGVRSYALAAAALPLVMILQSRGLYLAITAAFLLVLILGRSRIGTQVRKGLVATLVVGALALLLFFPFAPKGRLGQVSPSFVIAQLGTLSGRSGPSAGTIDVRKQWFGKVVHKVSATPGGWIVGVGLGPDLAFGTESSQASSQVQDALVRKPHNDYLEIFARYGLLGLAIFSCMLATALLQITRAARAAQGLEARFLWFVFAQTTVIALLAATQPYLSFPWGTLPLFLVLGAGLAVADRHARMSQSR